MRRIVWFLMICLIFLFQQSAVNAEEQKIIFTNFLPVDAPGFLTSAGVHHKYAKRSDILIDIPGLPRVPDMNFVYTVYDGELPNDFGGANIRWHPKGIYWPINIHIAVRANSNPGYLFHEAYHAGFLIALCRAGVDLSKVITIDGSMIRILFKGKTWSFKQIEDAVADIGTIHAARILGNSKIFSNRFEDVLEFNFGNDDSYELAKFLINLSDNDPDKYIENVGALIKALLTVAPRRL